jgi:hypothetical protein
MRQRRQQRASRAYRLEPLLRVFVSQWLNQSDGWRHEGREDRGRVRAAFVGARFGVASLNCLLEHLFRFGRKVGGKRYAVGGGQQTAGSRQIRTLKSAETKVAVPRIDSASSEFPLCVSVPLVAQCLRGSADPATSSGHRKKAKRNQKMVGE